MSKLNDRMTFYQGTEENTASPPWIDYIINYVILKPMLTSNECLLNVLYSHNTSYLKAINVNIFLVGTRYSK